MKIYQVSDEKTGEPIKSYARRDLALDAIRDSLQPNQEIEFRSYFNKQGIEVFFNSLGQSVCLTDETVWEQSEPLY